MYRMVHAGPSGFRILVIIPNGSLPRLGSKLDERGRLILYTTPRSTVARLVEIIHTALTNVGEPSQMRLQLLERADQPRLLGRADALPPLRTLQSLNIPSGSVLQILMLRNF